MSKIRYWLLYILFRIMYFVMDWTIPLWYCRKGKVVPSIQNPLLLKSAKKLAEEIREVKITSEEVIQAYIDRIKEVQPLINAVVAECFKEALHEAREVDKLIRSGTFSQQQLKQDKPLLGVPFSVKVLLNVKGYRNTAASKLFKDVVVATEDAESVAMLRNAGGIVLAITNSPEFGAASETNNLLYGKTCNPYDTNKSSGGSSGGEGALICAGGSVIGLGNDVAGSLRIPAHFTGIFAHKATRGLISSVGNYVTANEEMERLFYTGPMCRYSEDLNFLTKILTENHEEHSKLYREINFQRLKIFYTTTFDDPFAYPVDKEIMEGMMQAASHFVNTYGAVAQEIEIPLLKQSTFIANHAIHGAMPSLIEYVTSGKVTHLSTLWETIKFAFGKSTYHFLTIAMSFYVRNRLFFKKELMPYYAKLGQELTEEFDNILDENSVFFYPTMPTTAHCHHVGAMYVGNVCYLNVFNVTGAPVTVCPTGLNKRTSMPQSIQIVGRKYNDVLTMACASELDKVFGGWIPPGSN